MADHTKRLGALTGTPAREKKGTLDRLLRLYAPWVEGIQITASCSDGAKLYEEVSQRYRELQQMLQDVPVDLDHINAFLTGLQEFRALPGFRHSGLFLSEMLRKAGKKQYQLEGVGELHWVGVGLDGVILEAEQFGNYTGAFTGYTTCKTTLPVHTPKTGLVLVGQEFGDHTGYGATNLQLHDGVYGQNVGRFAGRMTILNGQYDARVGYNAGMIIICGGTFDGWVGNDALLVTILNGTFNGRIAHPRLANIHRGDFAERVWEFKMDDRSVIQLCGDAVEYEKEGKTRYKVTPWMPLETQTQRTMRMLMDCIPKSLLKYFPELNDLG